MTVKSLSFKSDFGDELALEKPLEVLRIVGLRLRKHALIHELVDWVALHCEERAKSF